MATERKDVLAATKQMIYQKRCLSRCSNRSTTLSNIPDGSQNQASAAIAPPVNDLLSRVTATIDIRKSTNPTSPHVSRIPPSNNNNEITPRTLPVEDLWEKASVVDSLFTVTRPFYRRTQIARVSLQAKNDFPVSQSVLEKAFEFCDSPSDMVISKDQNSRPSENNENVEISATSKICHTTDVQSMNAVPLSVLNQKNQAALCSSAAAKKRKEKSPKVASYRQMSRVEDRPSNFGAEIGAFEFGTKRCAEDEARANEATLSTKKNSNHAQLPSNIAGRPSRAGSRASQLSIVTKIRAAAVEKGPTHPNLPRESLSGHYADTEKVATDLQRLLESVTSKSRGDTKNVQVHNLIDKASHYIPVLDGFDEMIRSEIPILHMSLRKIKIYSDRRMDQFRRFQEDMGIDRA